MGLKKRIDALVKEERERALLPLRLIMKKMTLKELEAILDGYAAELRGDTPPDGVYAAWIQFQEYGGIEATKHASNSMTDKDRQRMSDFTRRLAEGEDWRDISLY